MPAEMAVSSNRPRTNRSHFAIADAPDVLDGLYYLKSIGAWLKANKEKKFFFLFKGQKNCAVSGKIIKYLNMNF